MFVHFYLFLWFLCFSTFLLILIEAKIFEDILIPLFKKNWIWCNFSGILVWLSRYFLFGILKDLGNCKISQHLKETKKRKCKIWNEKRFLSFFLMNELFPNFRKIKKFCQKSSTLLFGWLFRREKHDKVFFLEFCRSIFF